jgi:hypothetical protein
MSDAYTYESHNTINTKKSIGAGSFRVGEVYSFFAKHGLIFNLVPGDDSFQYRFTELSTFEFMFYLDKK